jgi:hypothetical protein
MEKVRMALGCNSPHPRSRICFRTNNGVPTLWQSLVRVKRTAEAIKLIVNLNASIFAATPPPRRLGG